MPQPQAILQEFLGVLAHMGWPASRLHVESGDGACWFSLPLPEGAVLLAAAVEKGAPDPADSYRNYEDLDPWRVRWIEAFRKRKLAFRYLLLLDGRNAQLIDVEDGLLLAAATGTEEQASRLAPLIDPRRAALGVRQAFPRRSQALLAAELRAWTDVWCARIGASIGTGTEAMAGAFDALLLERRLHLLAKRFPAAASLGPDRVPATAAEYEKRLRSLQETWNVLQYPGWRAAGGILHEAETAGLLKHCIDSMRLLGAPKFDATVFLEAFADEAFRHLGWKTALSETARKDPPEGEDWLQEQLELDVDEVGGVVALRRFEERVGWVRRWAAHHAAAIERGCRPGTQLDLLSEAPSPPVLTEAPNFVLRRLIRIVTADPRRGEVMRLALSTRACELAAEAGGLTAPLPTIGVKVLQPVGQESGPALN